MSYQLGDIVNGYVLGHDGTWRPLEAAPGYYRVGDVANGYVLGSDNQWRPLQPSDGGASATAALDHSAVPIASAPSKPGRRRWWLVGGAGLLVLIIIGMATNGGPGSTTVTLPAAARSSAPAAPPAVAAPSTPALPPSTTPAAPAAPAAPVAPVAGLNTPVRDGDFEFVLTKLECGRSKIGDQYSNTTAQGQFCLVSMTVTNIGKEPQMFSGSNQRAFDAQGRELEADDGAAVMYLEDAKSFFENINPGNTVQGTVIYDIPTTSKIVELELHDSVWSDGVTVKVG